MSFYDRLKFDANGLIPATLRPFTTPNLGAAVIERGGTFVLHESPDGSLRQSDG